MTGRAIVTITTVILFLGACTTTTSHRLVMTGSSSQAAVTCEAGCRQAAAAKGRDAVYRDMYAACLDTCPGATATRAPCPPPDPSSLCFETTKASVGSIVAVVVVVGVLIGLIILVSSIGSVLSYG